MTELTVQETVKETIKAANAYEGVDLEDLFASEDDIAELRASGSLDQTVYIQESKGGNYDNSWRYHRQLSFGDSDIFVWEMPLNKEQVEQGYRAKEININNPKHQVVAIRGIPIQFGWTPNWSKKFTTPDGKEQFYSFCKGTKLVNHETGTVWEESHPIKMPVSRMYVGKKRSNELAFTWQNNPHLEVFATRTIKTAGQEDVIEHRSCMDCVKNNQHFDGDINAPNVDKCSISGELLFAVFELGIKDATNHLDDPATNFIDVNWVSVADAGIKGYDNKELDKPFILRVRGLGSSQLQDIGKGQYDMDVVLPSQYKPNQDKDTCLPDDNVLSTKQYWEWLHNKKEKGRVAVEKGTGRNLYPVITEVYLGKLAATQNTKNYAPVFRPVAVGATTEYSGLKIAEYVRTAKACLMHEEALAKGQSFEFKAITPSESKALSAAVDNTKEVKTNSPKVTEVEPATKTMPNTALSAFTPPASL